MKFTLYQIKNLVNGHRYIGITGRGLATRKSQHLWNARNGGRTRLAAALRKYGRESFEFSVIEMVATRDEAVAAEINFIEIHRPEYNVTKGGDGAVGIIVSQETREKLSKNIKERLTRNGNWWIGRKQSPETLEKMRARMIGGIGYWRGKKRPPETVEKMRARMLGKAGYWRGKKRTPETIQKIIATKLAAPRVPSTERQLIARRLNFQKCIASKMKAVRCIEDGKIYRSLTEAGAAYGLHKKYVCDVCSGRAKQTHGWRFEYVQSI